MSAEKAIVGTGMRPGRKLQARECLRVAIKKSSVIPEASPQIRVISYSTIFADAEKATRLLSRLCINSATGCNKKNYYFPYF